VPTRTSRTGISSKGASGYTLIEMTIVVILLALCAGLLIPQLSEGLFSDDLKVGLRRIRAVTTQARQEAILKGAPQLITFEIGQSACLLIQPAAAVENGTLPTGGRLCLPSGVRVTGVRKGVDPMQESGTVRLAFLPNGLCEPALIYLQPGSGPMHTVSLKGLGGIEIFQGEPPSGDLREDRS
jgi:prepilin-type N-terminal cleavage/methylation domain-containing protein